MIKNNSKNKKTVKKGTRGITLIALVVTIALNCYRVAMELMLK